MKIQQIQSKIDVQLDFKSAIKFIIEGDVKEDDGRGHLLKRHFFLFNNILVVVKPKNGKWINKYTVPVAHCIVWNVPDTDQSRQIPSLPSSISSCYSQERVPNHELRSKSGCEEQNRLRMQISLREREFHERD